MQRRLGAEGVLVGWLNDVTVVVLGVLREEFLKDLLF